MEISHNAHQHKLTLQSANQPYYCRGCDQLGFGSSYTCNISECNFFFHKQCGNPETRVNYPFSSKCVLTFRTNGSGENSLCEVCAKKIKGYHYRCLCSYQKRNVHPSCLGYEHTLAVADGLTLYLKKVANAKCLYCGSKNLGSRVQGWAYASSCGNYCYHVVCVMEIINNKWRNGFLTGQNDPLHTIKQEFPSHMDKRQQLVGGNTKNKRSMMCLFI